MNCIKFKVTVYLVIGVFCLATAQSTWYGVKLGPAMNVQSWGDGSNAGSINRDPMFSINMDIMAESYDEFKKGAVYAQIGYHTRGSASRFFSLNNTFSGRQAFKYKNIVLELGGKKSLNLGKKYDPYFIIGIRGEFTVGTNLDDYLVFNSLYYPLDEYVNKFNYGLTAGGGFETYLSELSNLFFEFSFSPDLSLQYEQPPIPNVVEPYTGNLISLGLRQVRNLSLEFKIGIKFLRKVEYID